MGELPGGWGIDTGMRLGSGVILAGQRQGQEGLGGLELILRDKTGLRDIANEDGMTRQGVGTLEDARRGGNLADAGRGVDQEEEGCSGNGATRQEGQAMVCAPRRWNVDR